MRTNNWDNLFKPTEVQKGSFRYSLITGTCKNKQVVFSTETPTELHAYWAHKIETCNLRGNVFLNIYVSNGAKL